MNIEHTALIDRSDLVSMVDTSISWAQLERGKLDVAYRVATFGPLVLSYRNVNLACHIRAEVKSNTAAVATIESRRPGTRWLGKNVDSEALAVCRNELDLLLSGASTVEAIAVDEEKLHAQVPDSRDASDLLENLNRSGTLHDPIGAARLRSAIRVAFSMLTPSPPRAITGTIIPLLAATLRNYDAYSVERLDCAKRRFAAVRLCEKYMRENLCNGLSLLDLSRFCGMRTRSLINAFEAITGLSPMDYLKRLRLNEVQRALLRANPGNTRVIDVAMEWGFWHMGHFSRDYRAMFGEAPHQTLRTPD